MRAVERRLRRQPANPCQFQEQALPQAAHSPTGEAVVEGLAWPVFQRTVLPSAAGQQDLNDPADHTPIINPPLAANVLRQQGLQLGPLRVVQPEIPFDHR